MIYIDLQKFSLYEENSANLYRGRDDALISGYEMGEDGAGDRVYSKDLTSRFPRAVSRPTFEMTTANFKWQFVKR